MRLQAISPKYETIITHTLICTIDCASIEIISCDSRMSAVLGVYASASADSALLCRIHDCTFASSALFAASRVSTSLEKFGHNDGADVHLRGPAASLVAGHFVPVVFRGEEDGGGAAG